VSATGGLTPANSAIGAVRMSSKPDDAPNDR
jgi:hypothetical protein